MTVTPSSIEQVIPGQGSMAQPSVKPSSKAKRKRFRFIANGKAATGLIVMGIYVLIAIIGPWISPWDPDLITADKLQSPSASHWFGTDHLGKDIFSQILVGARGVVVVGAIAGIVATILSVLIGVTSGYLGGAADESLSAVSNVFLVIPVLPLIIIVTSTNRSFEDSSAKTLVNRRLAVFTILCRRHHERIVLFCESTEPSLPWVVDHAEFVEVVRGRLLS